MQNEYSELLLEQSPDALILASPDGKVLHWNRGAETVFGFTAAEATGRSLSELVVPPDRRSEEREMLNKARSAGETVFESLRCRKDGTLVYVDISTRVVRDERGTVKFVLSTKKDVTQLKVRRDAKLIEARFSDLLESVPDAIVMVNSTGRIILVNVQAERMFGYRRAELIGEPVEVLLPHRYRGGHVAHRARFFSHPNTRPMGAGLDLYGLRKDSTEFPVEIGLSPLSTEEGTLVMSAIRDITERKQAQEEIRRKNLELEEQNRRVQEASRMKSEFLANMSHELRTPLNGIIGFSEFLHDGKPGPLNVKQKEYLGDILNNGRHLLRLINDVLDLAKVEAGKMELAPEIFQVGKVIEEVCAVAKAIAQKKRIVLRQQVASDLENVTLDQQKFKQVIYNLLSNAVKFTDDDGSVEVLATRVNPQSFRLSVRDTGIGIRREDFPRLFKEFEQLDSGTARRFEGTGLGLALTKKIVEVMGGSITVDSEPGKGSTFSLVLPTLLAPQRQRHEAGLHSRD